MASEETVYYQDEKVRITNSRAVIGDKTFAMANITSVAAEVTRGNYLLPVLLLPAGLCTASIGLLSDEQSIFVVGIIFILAAFAVSGQAKNRYSVTIGSASGESNALTSTDKDYISDIVEAMNEAIIQRG